MSHKPPVVFPWLRPGAYFNSDPGIARNGLLSGHWTTMAEDVDNDGTPEVTTTRTRDARGRVVAVETVDTRDAARHTTLAVAYDDHGRIVSLDVRAARPHASAYKYDTHDNLVEETAVATDPAGARHTTVATHTFAPHGNVLGTVAATDGRKVEEREYAGFGGLKRMTTFDAAGNAVREERTTFDDRHRETKQVTREFAAGAAGAPPRTISEEARETTYFHGTDRPSRTHLLVTREFDAGGGGPPAMRKAGEETRTFAPPAGGVEHFEQRTFNPGPDGRPVETGVRIEDTTYDGQGRVVATAGTNSDINTGEKKAVRTVTTYRAIVVTTTDLGADGTADEESVTIVDEAGRVVESRDGKPGFGAFTRLQRLDYDARGEMTKRTTFADNSDKPSSVVTFS